MINKIFSDCLDKIETLDILDSSLIYTSLGRIDKTTVINPFDSALNLDKKSKPDIICV